MSLQRKLLVSFSIFLVATFGLMAAILLNYGTKQIELRALENMEVIGGKMAWQFDNLVRPMDFISVNLIATDNFMSSMSSLANIARGTSKNDVYISEAMRYIYVTLCNDAINRNFFSVNVFNDQGDLFSSRIQQPNLSGSADEIIGGFDWLDDVKQRRGKSLLIKPHVDPWNAQGQVNVFSLVRAVQGISGSMGYIEVQNRTSDLEKIFAVPGAEGLMVALTGRDGQLFYQYGFASSDEAMRFVDMRPERDFMAYAQDAEFTEYTVHLFQDRRAVLKPLTDILGIAGLIMIALLFASALFAFVLSRQFVKPIRDLSRQMEGMELQTLRDVLPNVTAGNELVTLETSFAQLRGRLSESIERELHSQAMQLQANFDSLQAQINPHFLYNILNVLSQKGMEIGEHSICAICADMAAMLRYTTSTKTRTATIAEELSHVRAYVALMKQRYEERIVFYANADPAVLNHEIPKIVLQQFVENSIVHSFEMGSKVVTVTLLIEPTSDGWRVEVTDDGPGFDATKIAALEAQMDEMRTTLLKQSTDFAIGGMGVLNTYARLWLFFGDRVSFSFGNREKGGAYVRFRCVAGGRSQND